MGVLASPLALVDQPYLSSLYGALVERGARVEHYSGRRLRSGGWDVWHLHWPEQFLNRPQRVGVVLGNGARLLWSVGRARRRGVAVVWTVHNLGSHERNHPWLERAFWFLLTRRLDGIIALTEGGRRAARERFPRLLHVPAAVVPLGHFRKPVEAKLDRVDACRRLGVAADRQVVCFLGLIRPYKGVPTLVRAFRDLAEERAVLLVAGRPSTPGLAREVEAAAAGDPRVHLVLRRLSDEEIEDHLAAADLVALPYREVLNSSTAVHALSADRPVRGPAKGAMAELQESIGGEWVRLFSGDLDTGDLEQALDWARRSERSREAPLDHLSWPAIADATLGAYDQAIGHRRRRRERSGGP
ncbi:GDP-mannose--glycolipid 4-beta-D-mannosyltransferase [soil metagenome]